VILSAIGFLVWFSHAYPFPEEDWNTTLKSGLRSAAFLLLVIAIIYTAGRAQFLKKQSLFGLVLLFLIWIDVITHAPSQNPTVKAEVFHLGLQPLQELNPKPQTGESRAMLRLSALIGLHEKILGKAFEGYICNRLGLYDNCNILDGIPKVDGFYALY